ncbi:MAG TPA: elongation factor G [Armatimonadota bacterium]|nr:elongation factor G [Armatimonadota bacterium]
MKAYKADAIRNIALVGHGGCGKTSLAEVLLFASGGIDRLGKVDDGTTASDYDPDEVKRKISISASLIPCEWKGVKINFIDAPGYADFVGDVKSALRVVEGALIVVCAVSGIEVGTEAAWEFAQEYGVPRAIFINKMDRENADFYAVAEALRVRFGSRVSPVQLPIGSQDTFKGVVDLIAMKATVGAGKSAAEAEIPVDMAEAVAKYREALVEAAAENDDELIAKYLEGEELTSDEIARGLAIGVRTGKAIPVFCGSALKDVGASPVLGAVVAAFPSPAETEAAKGANPQTNAEERRKPLDAEPFSALVFKTLADPYVGKLTYFRVYSGVVKSDSHVFNSAKGVEERVGQVYFLKGKNQEATAEVYAGDIAAVAKLSETGTGDTLCDKAKPIRYTAVDFPAPVYSVAISAKSKADEDKLGPALGKLADEDPTFRYRREIETGETLISGLGESHVEIIVDRLKRKFGVGVEVDTPKIPYRETITASAKAQGRHKKQTGGRGQYGDCWIEIEPRERGQGFEFVDRVVGGAIPRQYIPAVEKGVREAMERGILVGYPVVDIRVRVCDGSFHPVDSSEMAFKLAGILAFQSAAANASPILLEPMLNVEVIVPEEYMGDIMGDLNGKRGRILGIEPIQDGKQRIKAVVPQAEMLRYAIDLRSIARGRGSFSAEVSYYEPVPAHTAQQIIEQRKKEKEES